MTSLETSNTNQSYRKIMVVSSIFFSF